MTRRDDIEEGLLRCESLARELLQTSYRTRALIKEAGVSTPANDQPLTEQQLAQISAKRRQRLFKGKGK